MYRNSFDGLPEGYDINKPTVIIGKLPRTAVMGIFLFFVLVFNVFTYIIGGKQGMVNLFVKFASFLIPWFMFEAYLHEVCHWIAICLTTGRDAEVIIHKLPYIIIHKYIKKEEDIHEEAVTFLPKDVYLNKFASIVSLLAPFVLIELLIIGIGFGLRFNVYVILALSLINILSCSLDVIMAMAILFKCDKSVLSSFERTDMRSYEMLK